MSSDLPLNYLKMNREERRGTDSSFCSVCGLEMTYLLEYNCDCHD